MYVWALALNLQGKVAARGLTCLAHVVTGDGNKPMKENTPTILITDDDRAFRETLQNVFALRGFDTLVAADGEEAVQIIQGERIHLVLLDMHMPRLTGLETVEAVRETNATLPFVLITGGLNDAVRRQAENAEVFDVLEKPVELDAVTSVVADAFRQTYDWTVL